MMHNTFYSKSKKSNKLLIRAIIYGAIIIVIIIAWFLLAGKVKSIIAAETQDIDKPRQEVAEKYQERLSQSDKNAYSLAIIGKSLVEKNQTDLGLLSLLEAMKRDEYYRDIYLYTAGVYFNLGNYNKALETLKKTQDIDPLYPETQTLMARTYEALDNANEAKLCYDKHEDFSK